LHYAIKIPFYPQPHTLLLLQPNKFLLSLSPTPTPSDSADAMPIRSKTPTPDAVEEALVVFGEGGFIGMKRVDVRTLASAGCVSKLWHRTAQDGLLWEQICTVQRMSTHLRASLSVIL
jgi:hypothetical protein